MADGYWTPWHLAQAEIDRLREALHQVLCVNESTPVQVYQQMETIAGNALKEVEE
jgi:hypothetical protein